MSLCQGKTSEYWNFEKEIRLIGKFPNKGELYKYGNKFCLPNYDQQAQPEKQLYLCPKAIHFTNFTGYNGITASNSIKTGLSVNKVKFSWFSLIPDDVVQDAAAKPSPGVSPDASRYGRFKWSVDVADLLKKFENPVVKVLGTHVYKFEVMYALVLCESTDERFESYPLCPDESDTNSTIVFTTERTFLWSPFTIVDSTGCPWDHLALGIADALNIKELGIWSSCGTLNPDCSKFDKGATKEDADVYMKMKDVLSVIPKRVWKVAGLQAAMEGFDLDNIKNALTAYANIVSDEDVDW